MTSVCNKNNVPYFYYLKWEYILKITPKSTVKSTEVIIFIFSIS